MAEAGKKIIVRLVQEEGVIEGQQNLTSYITEFYKKLFGKSDISEISLDPGGVDKISEEDQNKLMENFKIEEIREAVLEWKQTKQLALMVSMLNFTRKFGT